MKVCSCVLLKHWRTILHYVVSIYKPMCTSVPQNSLKLIYMFFIMLPAEWTFGMHIGRPHSVSLVHPQIVGLVHPQIVSLVHPQIVSWVHPQIVCLTNTCSGRLALTQSCTVSFLHMYIHTYRAWTEVNQHNSDASFSCTMVFHINL